MEVWLIRERGGGALAGKRGGVHIFRRRVGGAGHIASLEKDGKAGAEDDKVEDVEGIYQVRYEVRDG